MHLDHGEAWISNKIFFIMNSTISKAVIYLYPINPNYFRNKSPFDLSIHKK